MSRYARMFDRLNGEGAFGAFLMLGDPDLDTSAKLLDAAVAGGADMVEVGIPFSDPIADGPVIQAAAQRALAAGVRVSHCFDLLADFRTRHAHVPIGILTYANIVAARSGFMRDAADAGADSLLIADVPVLEAVRFSGMMKQAGVEPVLIAAPNTPRATLARIAALSSAYTYCVARAGVTGERDELALDHAALFETLRVLGASPPVLGFGISTPGQVREALVAGAAGVISGSAVVRAAMTEGADGVQSFVQLMKAATMRAG